MALVLFSNLAVCFLRRPTTLIATFDTLLKNVEETKFLTTVRKVRGWYEKSMVRIVHGTKNPQVVRKVYGTKSLWYEKSGILNEQRLSVISSIGCLGLFIAATLKHIAGVHINCWSENNAHTNLPLKD